MKDWQPLLLHRAPERAHDAGGHRGATLKPEGIADGNHCLADPEGPGVAEREGRQPHPIDLEQSQLAEAIAPDQRSPEAPPVGQSDLDVLGVLDDVEVRQDVAAWIDDEAGTEP